MDKKPEHKHAWKRDLGEVVYCMICGVKKIPTCKKCGDPIKNWEYYSFDWCEKCNNYVDVVLVEAPS